MFVAGTGFSHRRNGNFGITYRKQTSARGEYTGYNISSNQSQISGEIKANYPFIPSPDAQALFTFNFYRFCSGGSPKIQVTISGSTSLFPDWEAYVDGKLVYTYLTSSAPTDLGYYGNDFNAKVVVNA
jgi:hypothetical protein